METKKHPRPNATQLLRALMAAIPKDEFWKPNLSAAYKAAKEFISKKGKRQ